MKSIPNNKKLVSCCWLYCGSCEKFLKDKCRGCKSLAKTPSWCKIRDCCLEKGYNNCAECKDFPDPTKCKKYNGIIIKTFAYFCGSDRHSATAMIKEKGVEGFAQYMSENKLQRIIRS